MKRSNSVFAVILALALTLFGSSAMAQITDLLKGFQTAAGGGGGSTLPDTTIADGLKEALAVGAGNAVEAVSRENGYFGNPQIKIPLPETVEKVVPVLRAVGYGDQVEAFDLSMNRAAEKAAPMAKDMFIDAIKQMSFEDARNILNGPDNAATLYLKEKTGPALGEAFKPIVRDSMATVGVTKAYQDLEAKANAVPFGKMVSFDLDQYVTDKSLDGLFMVLGQEESKIRQDPAARVTDLLKTVFGNSG